MGAASIIANYGSGTPKQAAAWVLAENETNNCNFQYWEVGNECYGFWEHDTHAIRHDPYTYATNAVAFIRRIKAAYPTVSIKVGVIIVREKAVTPTMQPILPSIR